MRQPETLAPLSTARNALGTRFCHACNDFRPIDQFRKGQGHVCRQHVEVPDPDGLRFCRVCQDLLPLSRFAADQKRFICRACTWKRTGKSARTKYRARRAHIQRLWSMCYTDRAAFHQLRVGVTQTDIARLLEAGSHTVSDAANLAVIRPTHHFIHIGLQPTCRQHAQQRTVCQTPILSALKIQYKNT